MKGGEDKITTGELQVTSWEACCQPAAKSREQEQTPDGLFISTLMSLFYPKVMEINAILDTSAEDQTLPSVQLRTMPIELPLGHPLELPEEPALGAVAAYPSTHTFEAPKTGTMQLDIPYDQTSFVQKQEIGENQPQAVRPTDGPQFSLPGSIKLDVEDTLPRSDQPEVLKGPAPEVRLDERDAVDVRLQADEPILEIELKPTHNSAKSSKEHWPIHIPDSRPEHRPQEVKTLDKGLKPHQSMRFDLAKAKEISKYLYTESLKRLPRTVELKVEPPELGEIMVRLEKKGESITVRFEPKSSLAVHALSYAKEDLEQSLASHGLSLMGFSVESRASQDMERDGRFARHSFPHRNTKTQPARNKGMEDYQTLTIKRGSFDYLV